MADESNPPRAGNGLLDTGSDRPAAGATGREWFFPWLRAVVLAVAAVALVTVLALRVVAAQHALHSAPTPRPAVAVTGTPGDQVIGPRTGAVAPDFYLSTWTWPGAPNAAPRTLHLAALAGKPVVINFWASWCDPCRQEAPVLEAAWKHYQAQGVIFVGIAIEDNDPDSLRFLRQYGITYWNGPDATSTIAVNEGVPGLPVTIFLNRQGRVAGRHPGIISANDLNAGIQSIVGSA